MKWPWRQEKAVEEVEKVVEEREKKTQEVRRAFFNQMMQLESIVDRLEEEIGRNGPGK